MRRGEDRVVQVRFVSQLGDACVASRKLAYNIDRECITFTGQLSPIDFASATVEMARGGEHHNLVGKVLRVFERDLHVVCSSSVAFDINYELEGGHICDAAGGNRECVLARRGRGSSFKFGWERTRRTISAV